MMVVKRPDLVFTDTTMPDMDGPALVDAMLRNPVLATISLVAMSAMPETTVRASYARYSAFLQKPFRTAQVSALLARLLRTR
jgi:CheY-like chemotaxis protein